jgi:hypothetical protein
MADPIKEAIVALAEKINESSTSCTPLEPFIKLGGGSPPSINYNIPQKVGFTVSSLTSITSEAADFFPFCSQAPPNNLWDRLDTAAEEGGGEGDGNRLIGEAKKLLGSTTKGKKSIETDAKFGYFKVPEPEPGMPAARPSLNTEISGGTPIDGGNNDNPITTGGNTTVLTTINTLNYNSNVIQSNYQQGLYPVPVKNFYGDFVLDFVPKEDPKPEIFLAIQFKVESFLGNYGAGKVVKTMSLMPGEKTNITVKTYKDTTESYRHSDNVLDSFSQSSADNLEKMFESESSESKVKSGGLSLGIKIGPVNLGGNASKGTTSASKTINKVLSKHVEESQAQRKVEVNTETNTTAKEGEETLIVRELKNINLSRVLNFTFRQMNQEYIVVTYIDDVSLVYSNGYPETEQISRLYDMDEFLATYIQDDSKRLEYRNKIIMTVYNLKDYRGNRVDCFIENEQTSEVPHSLSGQVDPETASFWGKDESFTQTVGNTTFSVPGIITQIERHILSTESVVAEALLGQAEALDCYNIQLQNEAVLQTKAANLEKLQQLDKIENLPWGEDGNNPLDSYKEVYYKCCADNNESE